MSALVGIGIGFGGSTPSALTQLTALILQYGGFNFPLKRSLLPTFCSSGALSYTGGAGWHIDNESKLIATPVGLPAFAGARMVMNLVSGTSEDFSKSSWQKTICTTPSANLVISGNSTTQQSIINTIGLALAVVGRTYTFKYRVQYVDIRYVQIVASTVAFGGSQYANYDVVSGVLGTSSGGVSGIALVSQGVYDVWFTVSATAGNGVVSAYLFLVNANNASRGANYNGDGVKSVGVVHYQAEDVTGQAVQTSGEYVPVGQDKLNLFINTPTLATQNVTTVAGQYTVSFTGTGTITFSGTYTGSQVGAGTKTFTATAGTLTCTVTGTVTNANLNKGSSANVYWPVGSSYIYPAGTPTDGAQYFPTNKDGSAIPDGNMGYLGESARTNLALHNRRWIITHQLTMTTPAAGTFIDGETVTAVGGGTGVYRAASSTSSFFAVSGGTGTFSGLLTGTTSAATKTISASTLVWVASPTMTVSYTANGWDGAPNSATTLTAGAANNTILQTITGTSAARSIGIGIKRRTGTGTISITLDGTNYTDVTSQLNSITYTYCLLENVTVANPYIGVKISTSGDSVDVDAATLVSEVTTTMPILTTTATVNRTADALTLPVAGNMTISGAGNAGTCYARWGVSSGLSTYDATRYAVATNANGRILSSRTGQANTTASTYDGTTFLDQSGLLSRANGVMRKQVVCWSGSTAGADTGLRTMGDGATTVLGGAYDGTMGAGSTIQFASVFELNGLLRDVMCVNNFAISDTLMKGLVK